MTSILGVHGIGHHRRAQSPEDTAAALGAEWSANLGADLRVAYYAPHLHRGTAQGNQHDPGTLEPAAQEMLVEWIEQMRPTLSIPQGERTRRARQAADWLTQHFGDAARVFAIAFCREVHTYLAKPDSARRAAARRSVSDAVRTHRPDVIVAHSLGSVVTYEALWHDPADVELLVTIGSPLAMPGVILPRLLPDTRTRPPGVRRWLNLADVGDIVAVPRGGLRDRFDGVERDVEVVIGTWDFHSVAAYLRCAEVRDAILRGADEL